MSRKPTKRSKRSGAKTPGECLAQIRMAQGYTQSGLAQKVGMRQNVLSEYESGRIRLHAEVLIRFADVLGVSVDELLGRKRRMGRPPIPPGTKILRRMEKLQKLPEPEQAHILRSLDMMIRGARKRQPE